MLNLKKHFSLFLICIFLLVLVCGCGNDDVVSSTSNAETVAEQDIKTKFYPDFTATLIPSADYGELITFVGGYYGLTIEEKTNTVPLYGLCTLDGRIVVDAVYSSVQKLNVDDTSYVYLLTQYSTDPKLNETVIKTYLASGVGAWIFEIDKDTTVTDNIGGGRIMLERTAKVKGEPVVYHDFYDINGKRIFTFDKALAEDKNTQYVIGKFSDGLAPVTVTVTLPDEVLIDDKQPKTQVSTYYIDLSGKKVLDTFTSCGEFVDGFAVVADQNGKYGVINTKGEYFINPQFRIINYNSEKELFCLGTDDYFDIVDIGGTKHKRVLSQKGNVTVLGKDSLIYKKTNLHTGRSEFFYADSNVPFTHKTTGQFPDENKMVNGFYVCNYGGSASVFNEQGETVISVNDFGDLVTFCGDRLVINNSNNTKTSFITPGVTTSINWLNFGTDGKQILGNRYIVLSRVLQGKTVYSLYDTVSDKIFFENSDSMQVINCKGGQYLSLVNNGKTRVCDSTLKNLLLFTVST